MNAREPRQARRASIAAYLRIPKRLMHIGCFGIVLAAFAGFIGIGVWLEAMGQFLVVPERLPARADAIVVLGGGSAAASREARAAELFTRGIAPLVITTGGPVAGDRGLATYANWSIERLERRGVPRSAVIATNVGDSTYTDALGVRTLAEERGWRTIVLVTDVWHTRRTSMVFARAFEARPVALFMAPAPSARFTTNNWWRDELAANIVITEYIKLIAFWAGIDG